MAFPIGTPPTSFGELLLNYEPDKLTLRPKPRSILVNVAFNAAFGLWFTYRAIVAATHGQWGWMAFCLVLVLLDILFVWFNLMKKGERLVIDKGTNRIQGRTDVTAAMVTEVERIQVVKNGVSFIVSGREVRPSVVVLTLRDSAEARWLGQTLADFIGVPLQVMA